MQHDRPFLIGADPYQYVFGVAYLFTFIVAIPVGALLERFGPLKDDGRTVFILLGSSALIGWFITQTIIRLWVKTKNEKARFTNILGFRLKSL